MVTTKSGDDGKTITLRGKRIAKDSHIIKTLSYLDFLQAQIDLLAAHNRKQKEMYIFIQKNLFSLGAELSLGKKPKNNAIEKIDVEQLELFSKKYGKSTNKFITFTKDKTLDVNEARVRCRLLEVELTAYKRREKLRKEPYQFINRLSDLLFMVAVKLEV